MKGVTTFAQMLLRTCFLALLALGIAFWTGHAINLIPLHKVIGLILVLSLWTLGVLGAVSKVNPALVAFAFVWGLVIAGLGFPQQQILVGDMHWVIRVLHLVVGLAAMPIGEAIAVRVKRGSGMI